MIKDIVSINKELGFNLVLSVDNFKWVVGNGESALFWEDMWCDVGKLCTSFHRL